MRLVGDSEKKAAGAYPNVARCNRMPSSQPQSYRTVHEAEGHNVQQRTVGSSELQHVDVR